jgi:hypothetical protein
MKGGTCIYTHMDICLEKMDINSLRLDFDIEACAVKLHFSNCKIIFFPLTEHQLVILLNFYINWTLH